MARNLTNKQENIPMNDKDDVEENVGDEQIVEPVDDHYTLDTGAAALFRYVDQYKKFPNKCSFNASTKRLGIWFSNIKQKRFMPNKDSAVYKRLSQNNRVKKHLDGTFDERSENEGKPNPTQDQWDKLIVDFCTEHKRLPKTAGEIYKGEDIGDRLKNEKSKKITANHRLIKQLLLICPGNVAYNNLRTEIQKCITKSALPRRAPVSSEILLANYRAFCDIAMNTVKKRTPFPKEKYNGYSVGRFYVDRKKELKTINDDIYQMLTTNGDGTVTYDFVKVKLDKLINDRKTKSENIEEEEEEEK